MHRSSSFIGRTTKDVEFKTMANGTSLAKFTLACNDVYKGKDGNKVETTHFFDFDAFGKQAEVLEKYLKKGHLVFIGATPVQNHWEKEGLKQSKISFRVNEFTFINGRDEAKAVESPASFDLSNNVAFTSDDIPF